jgi:hypothetical protein
MVGYRGSNKGTLYVGGDVAPMKGWRFQQGGGGGGGKIKRMGVK